MLTGLAIGLALVSFPLVCWSWGDGDVALAASLSLLAACYTATLAAMALPWLLVWFGSDPAFGSGPLVTVIQVLLTILIYVLIAALVVR